MKTTISIIACIYWIFFFKAEEGLYPIHIFQLIMALGLTILIGWMEIREVNSLKYKKQN